MAVKMMPRVRLRSRNRSRGRNGWSFDSMWITNMQAATPATIASTIISLELNQSVVSPRSSMSWNVPIAIASSVKPNRSNGRGLSLPLFLISTISPIVHSTPTGKLM